MENFRNDSNKRQLVDYNNVIACLGNYGLFCIDMGVMAIIRNLVRERGYWRTTYVVSRTDGGYYIPTYEEFGPIDKALSEFLGEGDMSCDILSGLQEIAEAIKKLRIGCNVGVRQSVFDGERWSGSTGTIYTRPTTFGGEGEFSTEEAFNTHLCDKANWLFEGFINAVGTLSSVSLYEAIAGSVGLAVIGVAFMSNPPVAVLTGLAIAVGVSFALAGFISDFQQYLIDNRAEFVCAIYNSPSAEDAYDAIDAIIDAALAYLGLAVGQEAMALVLMSFIDTDTISQAYADGVLPMPTDPVPCDCGQLSYTIPYGIEITPPLAYVESVTSENTHGYLVVVFTDETNIQVSVEAGLPPTIMRLYDGEDIKVYEGSFSSSTHPGVKTIELIDTYLSFAVSVDYGE